MNLWYGLLLQLFRCFRPFTLLELKEPEERTEDGRFQHLVENMSFNFFSCSTLVYVYWYLLNNFFFQWFSLRNIFFWFSRESYSLNKGIQAYSTTLMVELKAAAATRLFYLYFLIIDDKFSHGYFFSFILSNQSQLII